MQIKRLRLAGFKSFVEPADLRIEPGLTGVVGPNGCGKSNLLEALRWAMGENSARSMRGAGMDDVIFAGTATRPPRDFAEVSILAEVAGPDGPDEREVVRRIERGAGSAYRIDGRDVRARDVSLLFADAATGAHSPALVSQNRIGAVIAARPAERRAMLEEAAGIAGLHVRRKEAETRLRATEANLQRLDEMIADQTVRATSLRRQAKAAERYRSLSERIRAAEARMIFARWRGAVAAADAARAEVAAVEAQVADAGRREAASGAARHGAAEAVALARRDALAARERASEAGHALTALRSERGVAERRLAELGAGLARIERDRAQEGALAEEAAAALARLTEEKAALDTAMLAAGEGGPQLDAALAEAERQARDAEVALAQALARQVADAAEGRVAGAALAAARQRAERAAREVASVAERITALADRAAIEAERDRAGGERDAALAEAEQAGRALAWAEAGETAAMAERDTVEAARAAARADLAALNAESAALHRAQGGEGERLLDHLRAAPGFERALAAALGDELTTPVAAWTGSAVLPDDPPLPVGTLPLGERVTAPAALARRLAQVALVETDSGQKLAMGQRLVTREGTLRRWDGLVLAGGGGAAAERLERANRLAALDAARPAAETRRDEADAARQALDERLGRVRGAADGARALIRRAEAAARDAGTREDRARGALDRLAGQHADLAERAARAEAEAADAAGEQARAEQELAALPDRAAGDDAVRALSAEAARHRGAVSAARATRLGHERSVAEMRERLAATLAEGKGWRARAGEAARRIADFARRAAETAADIEALAGRPAALADRVAGAETAFAAARVEAEALATAERAAEAALRTAEDAHRGAAEVLTTAREARAGAAARLEAQELRRVEMGRLSGERFQCPAPVLAERIGFDAAGIGSPAEESAAHERLGLERERIGPVNLVADQELAELENAAHGTSAERDELGQAVVALRGSIGTLNREGRQRLRAAFEAVDAHFRRLFATLFDGGAAHLAMIDSDDPLEAGLEIMAQPPGKRLQSLTLLSGGEQALTAVALIFALFLTNPAPICVLDEVDAPLDDANIERFCNLLDRMAAETRTRYLIVTHNAVTMSRMHRLFGVTMIERGVSRLVSVDLGAAGSLLAAE